jgi:RNA polymerase sigma factor (sigma-70 family)
MTAGPGQLEGESRTDESVFAAVRRFQAGEQAAFEAIAEELFVPVARKFAAMRLPASEIDELVQQVLVRVYLKVGEADFRAKEQFWAWVYTIATRQAYKHWRKKRPDLLAPEHVEIFADRPTPADEQPLHQAISEEASAHLTECVDTLPREQQLYVLGPLTQDLTFRDAARQHGLTLGQFKHRYEKALDRLRECMKSKGHDVK